MGALLVGQSGGPTAVINATAAGVFKEALKHPNITSLYGAIHGIDGILSENFIKIEDEEMLEDWQTTPGAILGSVRFKLASHLDDEEIYQKIYQVFKKYDIEYFFYIGGNDSMDTCCKIHAYFKEIGFNCKVLGLPKTVDNDLVHTDHTPGYASAAKIVATTISEIYHDTAVYKKGRVTIVEVMGRDAGWLTAATHLANHLGNGPDLIYLPEAAFDISEFLDSVDKIYQTKKKVLIAVSEGIKDKDNNYILNYKSSNDGDAFGHIQLGGVASVLAEIVNIRLHLPVRAIELNLPQRCASHLGSLTDVKESFKCGSFGVKSALKGNSGFMVAFERIANYKIKYVLKPLNEIANYIKPFPKKWIINNNSISSEFIDYALPLIKGESYPRYIDGLPVFAKRTNKS